jgi:hypothetical protein
MRCLVPVSTGVAESPCAVSFTVCGCTCLDAVLTPEGFPSWGLPLVAVSSTRGTCSSAGGALAPLLCELSIFLYCTSVSCSRRVSPPSYPWTLVLRPRRMQLAYASWLASPSSLIESGDQSDLKWLPLAFVAPLLYSSLRNVVNADLFFLLALQQACSEGIMNLHYLSCGCSVVTLPYSGYRLSWRDRRLGGTCSTRVQLALMSPTVNSSSCCCRRCLVQWTALAATACWC